MKEERQPGSSIPSLQVMQCKFDFFVSQCVDYGIQYRCENCKEHRKYFIHWEVAKRPDINKDTGPKEAGHHSDVDTQGAAGLGHAG